MPKHRTQKEYKKSFSYITSLFLDSGAFTLSRNIGEKSEEDYYNSKEFLEYINAYVTFIKRYKIAIDLYANIDVIGNSELTWKNQRYLEGRNLHPVPVVHLGTDLKWLSMYINKKYKLIALGGLAGSLDFDTKRNWLDSAFTMICDTPNHLPRTKIHGFGVATFKFLLRYPWWSIDTTTWSQTAAYGGITVPHLRKGRFVFNIPPYLVKISDESKAEEGSRHFSAFSQGEKRIVKKWLSYIRVPFGDVSKQGEIVEEGVTNKNWVRNVANILYFEKFKDYIPEWPWPFIRKRRRTLYDNLLCRHR